MGGGRFFLCAFEKTGHLNFGNSNDYGDLDIFINLAIKYIAQKCNIQESQLPDLPKISESPDFTKSIASFRPNNKE